MNVRTLRLAAVLLFTAPSAFQGRLTAQQAIAPSDIPSARVLFARLDAAVQADIASGAAGHLTSSQRTQLTTLALQIRSSLEHAEDKSAVRGTLSGIGYSLNQYHQGALVAYGAPLPPPVQTTWNALSLKLIDAVTADLAEAERRFFIKYGDASERLNVLEILLHEAFFTRPPMGELSTGPVRAEPIARVTTLGYQWYADSSHAKPSSPIYEVGLTWYIFGGALARLNHVGLSLAYEHDLVLGSNVGGVGLHLGRFEVVGMCGALKGCPSPVVALSKNVQLVPWPAILRRIRD